MFGPGESNTIVEATTSCASDDIQTYKILVGIFVLLTAMFGLTSIIIGMYVVCKRKRKTIDERILDSDDDDSDHEPPFTTLNARGT